MKDASLREGFGQGLLEAAKDKNVWALSADLTESNKMAAFRDKYPARFVELGVSEQNMAGVAAGLSRIGKIPFMASFAVFSPGRNWDQIRVSICYSNHNVKIYGGHAGLTVGEDGATHQALEDIAITRCLPGMTVLVPCDAEEMRRATIAAAKIRGPVYLRGGRPKLPVITKKETPFVIGKANILRPGVDATIVACGMMVAPALDAAHTLAAEGIDVEVINCHTIKPFDAGTVAASAKKTGCVLTVEEHQVTGGLGSAVAETLSELQPTPLLRMGVQDHFGESGDWQSLLVKYGLTNGGIMRGVKKLLRKK